MDRRDGGQIIKLRDDYFSLVKAMVQVGVGI